MPNTDELVPGPGWATKCGYVPLKPAEPLLADTSALDRMLVLERLARYSYALDECLEPPLAECFTEDATWAANLMHSEDYGPFVGATEIASWLAGSFVTMVDQRRHLFINPVVDEQSANEARVFAMCLITGAKDKVVTPRCTGIYQVQLKKIDGTWLISTLFGAFDSPW